jgi:hypothetical protein
MGNAPLVFPTEIEELNGQIVLEGWIVLRGKKWYGYFRRTVVDAVSGEPKATVVSPRRAAAYLKRAVSPRSSPGRQ